MKTCVRSAFM